MREPGDRSSSYPTAVGAGKGLNLAFVSSFLPGYMRGGMQWISPESPSC